jgi:uncharacterized OB-fold protein
MTEPLKPPSKPLPKPDPLTMPFWSSLNRRSMEVQRCESCGSHVFYPRGLCPSCGSRALRWTPVSGRGRIYAFTIVHRPTNAAFRADAPYILAMVELDEGVRMMTNIVGVAPDPARVRIGMPVEVVYEEVGPGTTLAKFRPVAASP